MFGSCSVIRMKNKLRPLRHLYPGVQIQLSPKSVDRSFAQLQMQALFSTDPGYQAAKTLPQIASTRFSITGRTIF